MRHRVNTMKDRQLHFYVLIVLFISSSLNVGIFFGNLTGLNENKISSSSNNSEEAGFTNFGGASYITEANSSGSGNMLFAQKYSKIQGNELGLVTNTSFVVEIADWSGSAMQINVSKIQANITLVGEMNFLETRALNIGPPTGVPYYAQAIQVPLSSAYLIDVAFYLYIKKFRNGPDLAVEVWDAIDSGGLKPNTRMTSRNFEIGTGDPVDYNAWVKCIFPTPVLLNSNLTAGKTFFIALQKAGTQADIDWYGANDSLEINEFNAVQYNGSVWKSYGFDFSLNTTLTGVLRPSEVNLKINGTAVTDGTADNGTYYSTFSHDLKGPLLFRINAQYKINLALKWILTISKTQFFNSSFFLNQEWTYSRWNATQTVDFLMNALNSGINISIPGWNIERVEWNGLVYSNWNVKPYPGYQKVTIFNASNGIWTVKCNSTNYVKNIIVRRGVISTNIVNSTDTVNIYGNFRQRLTTGYANLTIFPLSAANHKDSLRILGNTSIQFPSWTISDTATDNPGTFTLQVMWCNGTEVGLNSTRLNVLSIPTKLVHLAHTGFVATGDSIYVAVNFSNRYNGAPISGASLLVKNSTNDAAWPALFQIIRDYLNGTFSIEILTLGLSVGEYDFSINLSKPLYSSSEISGLSVTIGGGPSNISMTAPGCIGLLQLNSSYAIANPAPYHNAITKVKLYYFNALTLQPLSGGIVSASWIGGGPGISWMPAFFGYYNITIDVTGFHAGSNHTLKISIQQAGYTAAVIYLIVPIRKLPTLIEPLETHYEAYLAESLTIFAVFKDTFNGESIPSIYDLNGNFTAQINGFSQNMTPLLPTIGIYRSTLILSQLHLNEGKIYNITLFAFSSEHQMSMLNISLFIIPRRGVSLILLAVPEYLLAGTAFKVYARLTDIDGTPLYNVPLVYNQIFYPGSLKIQTTQITNGTGFAELGGEALANMQSMVVKIEYLGNFTVQNRTIYSPSIPIIKLNSSLTLSSLPTEIREGETLQINATLLINGLPAAGEIIVLKITYEGSDAIDVLSVGTNAEGVASAALVVPKGITKLHLTASYEGMSYINTSSAISEVNVISLMTLVWRYAPIWLSITVALIGIVLTYKYGYKRTKINRLKAKWQTTSQKFQNALNLNFLMIILRNSGIPVYNHSFKGEKVDYELVSGFLQAISMFKKELIKTGKKEVVKKPEWEMSYQEFKIFGIDREVVQFIFILEEAPSDNLKHIFNKFIVAVEDKYQQLFTKFRGNTTDFEEINTIVKEYFETTLILPHYTITVSNDDLKQLSDLERQIYKLGLIFMKQQGYFYIHNLLDSMAGMSKKEKDEILHETYTLIQKNYFTSSRMSILLE